jgi:putative ABC transport system permease protein
MEEIVPTFSTLGAALLLVLLLACANVGNLQLARMLSRRQEIAVRLSLGAGRRRVVRQLLTESTCLGMTAGLMGLGLAWIVPPVFLTVVGVGESASRFVPDGTVLVFTIGLAVGTSFIFALAPALQVTRDGTPLVVWARTGIDARGRRLRSLLLASQIALSLTLLTAGGLLTRGIFHAYRMDFGFDAQDTAYAFLSVPDELRSQREAIWTALDAALERSSVWAAWADEVPPLWGHCMCVQVRRPDEDASWDRQVYNRPLSSAGFDLLGLQFVEGGPHADRPELRQAVINETLARTLFGEETAVGRTLMAKPPGADADSAPYTITGVVRDTHYTSPLGTEPLLHTAPEISRSFLLFRTDRPGATSQLQAIVRAVDSRIRTTSAPVTSQIDRMIEELRLALGLIWAIGLIGLTLAAVGVFGVFSYAVEERRREIGIRLALGARGQDVLHAMFAVNRWSVGGGVAVGLLFSLAVGAVLRRYLFGLSPLDPAAYLAMTTLLLLAALAATLLPLRRAIRIDPATTLRGE